MSFELRSHTADVAVEATGPTLGAAYAAVAEGMGAAMCEEVPAEGGERFDLSEHAESREALLYEYLDRLIVERDVRRVLPVDHGATVTESDGVFTVTASARGIPFEAIEARDLKAVTYAEMTVERCESGWRVYVVFDV